MPAPAAGQVNVRVEATSVNPIDAKRAAGYGQRLLSLKGAGRFPLVLGNDIAGVVEVVGSGTAKWRPGDRVFGLLPTGRGGGVHASHVAVSACLLRPAIETLGFEAQAVFPYSFTTLWQALRGAGINMTNAKGLEVLVHGASGGLGQMALQLLAHWGASVTAICSTANKDLCQGIAAVVWNRQEQGLDTLPAHFDAGLNFGSWQDELTLISRLKHGALGYATTVHPLLANFDRYGWLAGAWKSRQDWRQAHSLAAARGAKYRWIVFQPEEAALNVLQLLLKEGALTLAVGIAVPLSEARLAFGHIAAQKRGRAVLVPTAGRT
jgi:NADPH:quinone reductase-like Zn-dependent oxidoreductase